MGWSTEVVLTLGYDAPLPGDERLHEYLGTGSALLGGQALDKVSGNSTAPDGYTHSLQVGAVRIYAGCLRKVGTYDVCDWLHDAPWGGQSAIVVIDSEHADEPQVFEASSNGVVEFARKGRVPR